MSDDSIESVRGNSPAKQTEKAREAHIQKHLQNISVTQEASESAFTTYSEQSSYNPRALKQQFKTLKERSGHKAKLQEQGTTRQAKQKAVTKDTVRIAREFATRNPELADKSLIALQGRLTAQDTEESITQKVTDSYPDAFLADESMDFLINVNKDDRVLHTKIRNAKQKYAEVFEREIKAGRNIAEFARSFAGKGLGSPTALRELYRDITGNPRDPQALFEELQKMFSKSDVDDVLKFLLHSLGADFKSKGPSISKGLLSRLMGETRNMQAFVSLYRFFQSRLPRMKKAFEEKGLEMPSRLRYDKLGEELMKLLKERYPSVDKVLRSAPLLGISQELIAQVIVYTQFRDAMRHVSPKLFKSEKQRQELLRILVETLCEIEEALEESEEEDEEE